MVSINMIVVGGHLGADPESRVTSQGKQMCTFKLATNRWDSKTQSEEVDWHAVTVFDKTAENCLKYLRKGSPVLVEGRLQSRHWDAPDGKKQTRWEVVGMRVSFLGQPRSASQEAAPKGALHEARHDARTYPGADAIPF
jgi:single-strand DNA-binding protein